MAARVAGWVKKAATVAEEQAMLRCPPISPDLTPCDFFSYGDILRNLSFYHLYHWICRRLDDESLLPSLKRILTCCSGYRRKGLPAWRRGELSYLAPLGSENISAPYFKHCFFRGGGYYPPRQSNTTPPSPKTEITNIWFYIFNFAWIIKFKM